MMGADVMVDGDPIAPVGAGSPGHGKVCAAVWNADPAANATTKGRQLALMMEPGPLITYRMMSEFCIEPVNRLGNGLLIGMDDATVGTSRAVQTR